MAVSLSFGPAVSSPGKTPGGFLYAPRQAGIYSSQKGSGGPARQDSGDFLAYISPASGMVIPPLAYVPLTASLVIPPESH
jgi:hypothetical protein